MQSSDLEQVLAWRNHPNVRQYMLTQHEITPAEHRDWFEHTTNDPRRRLMIVDEDDVALGFVHFSGVAPGGISDWGFYLAPDVPPGSGRKLGRSALDFAFQSLELHKVCGKALGFNEASIRFHLKLGFQQEGLLSEQYQIGNIYHDLVCFGLLRKKWITTGLRKS